MMLLGLLAACSDDTVTPDTTPTPDAALYEAGIDGPVADLGQADASPAPDGPGIDHAVPDAPRPDLPLPVDGPISDAMKLQLCQGWNAAYVAALQLARKCSPMLPVVQCTTSVSDELACPCPTFVEQANSTEIQQLTDLKSKWQALGCASLFACPAMPCYVPPSAGCTASGGARASASTTEQTILARTHTSRFKPPLFHTSHFSGGRS